MTIRVREAFLASGCLNAITPLDIASIPVRAAHPFENAPRIRNIDKAWGTYPSASFRSSAGEAFATSPPERYLIKPKPIMNKNEIRKMYVGAAKNAPDSRTPRRLARQMKMMNPTPMAMR